MANLLKSRHEAADPASSLPLVQGLETTGHSPLPTDYRQIARKSDPQEWEATADTLESMRSEIPQSRINRFRECRQFAFFFRGLDTGQLKIHANACHYRWCPICAAARSHTVLQSVTAWSEKQPELKFMTLTLASSDAPLSEQMTRLYESFHELRRRKLWKDRKPTGCWFFQTTYNHLRQQWHPHLHILCNMEYFPQRQLSELWHEITGDSYVLDIKAVDDIDEKANYVARYVSRPGRLASLHPLLRTELLRACHGRRLCGVFGKPAGLRLGAAIPPESEPTECIGSWFNVVSTSNWNPTAAIILHAFFNGIPLPAGIDCHAATIIRNRGAPLYMSDTDFT